MQERDLWWLAGFFEGEASFSGRGSGKGCLTIAVSQVQREPLERVQKLLGGTIYQYDHGKNAKPTWSKFYRWTETGKAAADLMIEIYPLMSPKRQDKIAELLEIWTGSYGKGGWQKKRTHCPKGHEYTPENTYRQPSKPNTRKCRTCAREYFKTYQRKTAQVRI